MINYSISR